MLYKWGKDPEIILINQQMKGNERRLHLLATHIGLMLMHFVFFPF